MINNPNNSNVQARGARSSWLVATVLAAISAIAPLGQAGPKPAGSADINTDGVVDVFDLAILLIDYSGDAPVRERGARSDLNHDGFVNSVDLAILLAAMG